MGEIPPSMTFRASSPVQHVAKRATFTAVIFTSGKCRLMGLKRPLDMNVDIDMGEYKIRVESLQSATWTFKISDSSVHLANLYTKLAKRGRRCMFEPELFPALRIMTYDPMCVNIFSSGKCVVMGSKTTDNINQLVWKIRRDVLT